MKKIRRNINSYTYTHTVVWYDLCWCYSVIMWTQFLFTAHNLEFFLWNLVYDWVTILENAHIYNNSHISHLSNKATSQHIFKKIELLKLWFLEKSSSFNNILKARIKEWNNNDVQKLLPCSTIFKKTFLKAIVHQKFEFRYWINIKEGNFMISPFFSKRRTFYIFKQLDNLIFITTFCKLLDWGFSWVLCCCWSLCKLWQNMVEMRINWTI